MEWLESEIVIVGGGITGITAALDLLSANRQVLLLDGDTDENSGGLARECFWRHLRYRHKRAKARREWSDAEKQAIIAEAARPGANISAVARWREICGLTSRQRKLDTQVVCSKVFYEYQQLAPCD